MTNTEPTRPDLNLHGVGSISEAVALALGDAYAGIEFEDSTFERGTEAVMAALRERIPATASPSVSSPEGGEPTPLKPFVLGPVAGHPDTISDEDEEGQRIPGTVAVGWDISSGCRVNFAQHDGALLFHLSLFGDVMRRGVEQKTVTPRQLRQFARKLADLADCHEGPPCSCCAKPWSWEGRDDRPLTASVGRDATCAPCGHKVSEHGGRDARLTSPAPNLGAGDKAGPTQLAHFMQQFVQSPSKLQVAPTLGVAEATRDEVGQIVDEFGCTPSAWASEQAVEKLFEFYRIYPREPACDGGYNCEATTHAKGCFVTEGDAPAPSVGGDSTDTGAPTYVQHVEAAMRGIVERWVTDDAELLADVSEGAIAGLNAAGYIAARPRPAGSVVPTDSPTEFEQCNYAAARLGGRCIAEAVHDGLCATHLAAVDPSGVGEVATPPAVGIYGVRFTTNFDHTKPEGETPV